MAGSTQLRLILAIAIVATACSAPTWMQQLKHLTQAEAKWMKPLRLSMKQLTSSLTSTSGGSTTGNCNCEGCHGSFWSSSVAPVPGGRGSVRQPVSTI